MSIFDETVAATGFDPADPGPSTEFENWDVVPAPSLAELMDTLTEKGSLDITREWQNFNADLTMRLISARDDTQTMPKIELEETGAEGEES